MEKRKIYAVVGPTASGKSDFAVELALSVGGEVISVDSRQMYADFDITSGKITKEEMKGVKHHMLSIYDIRDEEVTVSRFAEKALHCIETIYERGNIPILCGGTGLYMDALLYEKTFPEVPPQKELRASLQKKSALELSLLLKEKDPVRYEDIDKQNKARLVRALEICEVLGIVPKLSENIPRFDATIYSMAVERDVLRSNIEKRLEKRLAIGMVEEVKKLLDGGIPAARLLSLGLEFTFITEYLLGIISEEEMKRNIVQKSFDYAKRQMTWNKKYIENATLVNTVSGENNKERVSPLF